MNDNNQENKTIQSGTEFMTVIGIVIMVLGFIMAVSYVYIFDWETYNSIKDLSLTYENEIEMMTNEKYNMFITAGLIAYASVIVGSFFIAVDRIALTLKKILISIDKKQ